jgi:hypothetical protein
LRQFADEHLLQDVASILKTTDMAAHLLELEISCGPISSRNCRLRRPLKSPTQARVWN